MYQVFTLVNFGTVLSIATSTKGENNSWSLDSALACSFPCKVFDRTAVLYSAVSSKVILVDLNEQPDLVVVGAGRLRAPNRDLGAKGVC